MDYLPIKGNLPFYKEILTLSQLPAPIEGVIDLTSPNITYKFYTKIDLQGNTVNCANITFEGTSQEKTGFENGNVNFIGTCKVSDFLFENCAVTINAIDGAFDWSFVNFLNCLTGLNIVNAENCVFDTFGFINSPNCKISGTVASVVFSPNCIWRSVNDNNGIFFDITPTAVVTRRIRIQDSVFQTSFAGQTAIRVQSGANIGIEGFITKTVRFQGPGTALNGINGDDDRAFFFEPVGGNSIASTSIANMYMKNNTTPTTISAVNARYPMSGVTQFGPIKQRFTHDPVTNTLTYTSSVPRIFTVQATYTVLSGVNNVVGVYIGVNRNGNPIDATADRITESEMYTTTSGTRPDSGISQCIVSLNQGDKVYLIVQNTTSATDITISFMNMIIQKSPV